MGVRDYLLIGEAARQRGKVALSISTLRAGAERFPRHLAIKNNLIYILASRRQTLPEALELLPIFLELGADQMVAQDTVAYVYMKAGQLEKAQEYMDKALAKVKKSQPAWTEMQYNAAELAIRRKDFDSGREILDRVLKESPNQLLKQTRGRELMLMLESQAPSGKKE